MEKLNKDVEQKEQNYTDFKEGWVKKLRWWGDFTWIYLGCAQTKGWADAPTDRSGIEKVLWWYNNRHSAMINVLTTAFPVDII